MKARDLRELTNEELKQRLADSQQELFNLRMQRATGQIERPVRLRAIRRDIARMHTIMKQKGII